MLKTTLIAAAVAVGSVPALASAGTPDRESPRYELKRVPMGPRPDRYVFVRINREGRDERPEKLTGQIDASAKRKLVQRWAGTHYIGPVWELDRDAD